MCVVAKGLEYIHCNSMDTVIMQGSKGGLESSFYICGKNKHILFPIFELRIDI